MSKFKEWPLVHEKDDGIRPAGKPDECFYCQRKVGKPHGLACVVVTKRIKVRYTFEIEVDHPYSYTKEDFEFHRNESSWCADNALDELRKYAKKEGCLCNSFNAEYLEVTDWKAKRKVTKK